MEIHRYFTTNFVLKKKNNKHLFLEKVRKPRFKKLNIKY